MSKPLTIIKKLGMKPIPKSPLRYPGGKARAVKHILGLIPYDIDSLVSPFFGGGSIEIAIASLQVKVIGYDIFEPLVDFWQELLKEPKRLAEKVKQYYPLPKEKFYELQKLTFADPLENAAVFFVLNRSSFSGSTLSGGMSPGHPRFTIKSIDYISNFYIPTLQVYRGDFRETITMHTNEFLYLDPPYLINQTLYGKNGNTHKDFDHHSLNKILNNRGKWILSYNDSDVIREMYKDFTAIVPEWKYGMSTDKRSRELLILSQDLSEYLSFETKATKASQLSLF